MILLDSDVAIDILRNFKPAAMWLKSSPNALLGIPGIVMMELIQGCKDNDELLRLKKIFRDFRIYWPNEYDSNRALQDFEIYYLKGSLGLLDCLVAETAIGMGASLASFNIRHFSMLENLILLQPYAR